MNTTWTAGNFLSCIEHSFSDTVTDWYDSLDEEGKNVLRTMETLATMFQKLCKKINTEFIRAKLDSEDKARKQLRKINNIELLDMRYLENCIAEFSQYYCKIGRNETNLNMFYD